MARTTKTTMRKAVNNVFALVREGHSITTARKLVAKEVGIVANTLWTWQDKLNMKTPVITNKIAKASNNTLISRQNNINVTSTRNWRSDLGKVFTSLIDKDGTYSIQEAGAISQVANAALGQAKHELDVHKLAEKTTSERNESLDHLLL